MNKVKINNGLGSIILIAAFLTGWANLLVVALLMMLFGEIEDSFKGVVVRIVTFVIGYEIVLTGWGLLYNAYDGVFINVIDSIQKIILSYDNTASLEFFGKFHMYVLDPIGTVLSCLNSVVQFLAGLAELAFVISIISNKAMKENFVVRFINNYVTKVINYVNAIDFPAGK